MIHTGSTTKMCLVTHSSPRRLAGEKKVTAIIIKQQCGFPMSTVNFRFKEVQFKEVFRFKQEFHFPKMKK